MPQPTNKLSRFWQELKRRKVVRVIVMYAGVTFIITELVSNISEPLYLPDWIATFVILMLIIGFPIIAILSWIFDFLGVVIEIMFAPIHMLLIIHVAGDLAQEIVKAPFRRSGSRGKSDIPIAECTRRILRGSLFDNFGNEYF